MERILCSACLLGEPCRYDGRSKPCDAVALLATEYELIPICPECDGGLPTPRPPCEIVSGRAMTRDGRDFTEFYVAGAMKALETAKNHGCRTAVLKAKSPSCGLGYVYNGGFSGELVAGNGFTAELLEKNGVSVFTEEQLGALRERLVNNRADGDKN